jgi:hypothetical protein
MEAEPRPPRLKDGLRGFFSPAGERSAGKVSDQIVKLALFRSGFNIKI